MESVKNFNDRQLVDLKECERRLGYPFRNRNVLFEAITHASSSNIRLNSYERMEFLGDSILGFVVCEYLFQTHPDWLEGQLTKIKSVVVSRQTCARIGYELGIDDFLVVGKGIGNRGPVPDSLLANAFESIVAAVYLDGGMESVKTFLMRFVPMQVELAIAGDMDPNFKSDFQQFAQKKFGLPPTYKLVGDCGPDHEKWFQVVAILGKESFTPAWGRNKKEAEQKAAANALASIEGKTPPYDEHEFIGN